MCMCMCMVMCMCMLICVCMLICMCVELWNCGIVHVLCCAVLGIVYFLNKCYWFVGKDLPELLFNLMDEFLFRFCAENFLICRRVEILELNEGEGECSIKVRGHGEMFDLGKHPQGTEIKAITYSNMQIHNDKPTHDVYVIVDI
eukprot:m.73325 g.73325  ORF g.73325 m.73325 type:complete len:144 (+) comp8417_c0_seq2:3-434(+)